ncbi:glycosyltransferase [Candidatus Woesearchaeota archaeon]|nr:glycosyltransferase [Candidatus Woesearchaeota archaeon]
MISVVIPACNEGDYISKTLESVKKQRENHEVVVVCNGCTDNTYKVAKRYTKKVFILNKKNVSKARNYGANKAKGKILVFLDADTQLTEGSLKKILETMNHSTIIGTCKGIPESKKLIYRILLLVKNNLRTPVNGILFCKKNIFNKIGGYDNNKTVKEHRDLIKRALNYGQFGLADTNVVNSMRRFEKLGFGNVALFWLKNLIGNKEKYKIIR